ncbi:MAG TPA: penicillin-binding protein 2 [Candidatus Limnocylindrales bacterium]
MSAAAGERPRTERPRSERPRSERPVLRFIAFGVAIVVGLSALTARLFYLQIANGIEFATRAEANRSVLQAIPSSRGLIYDRSGRPLVTNVPSFSVKIVPDKLPLTQREEVVGRLSALLAMDPADINAAIDSNPGSRFDLVRIAQDVPEATARLIAEEHLSLPGVQVVVEARRDYLTGPLLSQVIGYTGPVTAEALPDLRKQGYLPDDLLGKTGVEAVYESELRGTYGTESVERDASGRKLQVLQTVEPAKAGDSLELTIDLKEQRLAQKALEWGMTEAGLKRGVVIVMNPQTGEILALVSLPTYDDNDFARGISTSDFKNLVDDPNKPLLDHAIAEQFPPGSTFKIVGGTGALADHKITPQTELDTRPFLSIGPYRYYEWNHRGWGPLTIFDGFGHSSDTFFFQVAGLLGIDRLAYWAHQYGFGTPTGVDLPGEAAGIVPSNQWKQDTFGQPIFPGEVYQAGIGQGYDAVTPLQLINAYAALANGGRLLQPQIVRRVVGPDGSVVRGFKPELIHKVKAPSDVLRTMREAARRVVTIRHTYNLVELPINVAGKSGTAEFGLRDAQGRLPFHSWFVGFVPKDPTKDDFTKGDSQLIVLAFAYDSRTKGNVATEIVKYYLQLHFGIEKDYRITDLLERGNFYQGN